MVIKKLSIAMLIVLSVFGTPSANAAGQWTAFLPVLEVYSYQTGYLFLRLDPVTAHINPDGCTHSTVVRVDANQKNIDHIMKIALTAQASGQRVSLYIAGCGSDYPKVLHIRIRK